MFQEALSLGEIWLDAYSRRGGDVIKGMGSVKREAMVDLVPFSVIDGPLRGSPIAKHIHDDVTFFKKVD